MVGESLVFHKTIITTKNLQNDITKYLVKFEEL